MAIVKTNPAPPMTVGHYRDAALRHFNTCKVLWRYINLPDTSNLKNINEEIILKNVFYLSGYVVECALKYRYCKDCHNLNDADQESVWRARIPPVILYKHFSQIASGDRTWSDNVLQRLNASSTINIPNHLKKLCTNSPSSLILNINEELLFDMQGSWEPTIRYHFENNGLTLNKSDIEAFFSSTKTLLRNFSMI
jgi:hypothetical protein